MNILITGISGFVGEYLAQEIVSHAKRAQVFGIDRSTRGFKIFPKLFKKIKILQCDITNSIDVKRAIEEVNPDQIYHLAGFASGAGKDKKLIFNVNVNGTINLLKSLQKINKKVKILLSSTAYVYGNTLKCANENSKIDAKSFYDQSKIEMEKKSKKFQSKNLQIIIARPTNHIGAGQKLGFVVPDFMNQIINAKNNGKILVGNLKAQRDFFDVRDCVLAYRIIMKKGKVGEIYNIGTGKTIFIKEILEKLIKISGKKITHKSNPKRMRPSDIAINCVNPSKLKRLGWQPKIGIDKSLRDVYRF